MSRYVVLSSRFLHYLMGWEPRAAWPAPQREQRKLLRRQGQLPRRPISGRLRVTWQRRSARHRPQHGVKISPFVLVKKKSSALFRDRVGNIYNVSWGKWHSQMAASVPRGVFLAVKRRRRVTSATTIVTVALHRVSTAPTTQSKKITWPPRLDTNRQTVRTCRWQYETTRSCLRLNGMSVDEARKS